MQTKIYQIKDEKQKAKAGEIKVAVEFLPDAPFEHEALMAAVKNPSCTVSKVEAPYGVAVFCFTVEESESSAT